MPYRLVAFDKEGKIVSISQDSYEENSLIAPVQALMNPKAFSFVDEDLLPTGSDFDILTTGGDPEVPTVDGTLMTFEYQTRNAVYDPRVEAILTIDNPNPYYFYNDVVVQDETKVSISKSIDTTTTPVHNTTIKKFGPSSGKFTRSLLGYTAGTMSVVNLNRTGAGAVNGLGDPITRSFAAEMFFYTNGTAGANNFTLFQKGPTGASANWKLGYDAGAGFLQFAWQSFGSTGGYNYSQNIVNTATLTGNTWHHVAVAVVYEAGATLHISGYFDGAVAFTAGVTLGTLPEYRFNAPLYIGNNHLGTEGFDGYIDSVRVWNTETAAGKSAMADYGFLPYGGGTLGVPTLAGFTVSQHLSFVMNFNNIAGSCAFHAESTNYVQGTICKVGTPGGETGLTAPNTVFLGVRNIVKYERDAGATGLDSAAGFTTGYGTICKEFISALEGTTFYYGITVGNDIAFNVYDVRDTSPDISVFKTYYKNSYAYEAGIESLYRIEGDSTGRGSSGSILNPILGTNPFRRLFTAGWYGDGVSYTDLFIAPRDNITMSYIMDNGYMATQGICYGSYYFVDGAGIGRTLTAQNISDLRLDILEFNNNLLRTKITNRDTITSASAKGDLRTTLINAGIITTSIAPPKGLG